MRLLAIAALTIIIGACDSCVAAPQLPPSRYIDSQTNVEKLLDSTVDFVMLDPEDPDGLTYRSFCSGFFVSPTTLISAGHCVLRRGDNPFEEADPEAGDAFHYRMHGSDIVHTARVSGFDGTHDVASLEIGASEPRQPRFLEMEQNAAAVGDQVFVVGNPGNLTFMLSDGIITHLDRDAAGRLTEIMANAQVWFGNSGGCIVNNRGQVIGIADAISFRQAYLAHFVPIRFAAALGSPPPRHR